MSPPKALWFLKVALDQIQFMSGLFDLDAFAARLRRAVETSPHLDPRGAPVLQAVLARGHLPRGEAAALTGLGDRMGRTVLSQLVGEGLLVSDTPKGPVRIGLPTDYLEVLFPRLFYEV